MSTSMMSTSISNKRYQRGDWLHGTVIKENEEENQRHPKHPTYRKKTLQYSKAVQYLS